MAALYIYTYFCISGQKKGCARSNIILKCTKTIPLGIGISLLDYNYMPP